ncbi:MAG: diguanylate cyclase, partial [Candidatus Eremiobacteraeota bacterium]|nr:diguanylate cyclase [Candidatus Eremiobacteraeota bacterium]
MPDTAGKVERRDRDLVRRAALLLSADLPLRELFGQFAVLLSSYVDASMVLIATEDGEGGRVEFLFEDGVGAVPDDPRLEPESTTAQVLRTSKSALYRSAEDWPARFVLVVSGQRTKIAESAIFVPILFGSGCIGVLSVQSRNPNAYDEQKVELLETCALYLGSRIHEERRREETTRLSKMAMTDSLTGLNNRRAFDERLSDEWNRCRRYGMPLSLIFIDVDFFKAFNDTYGHVAGDACLRQVGEVIGNSATRAGDVAARVGGEEFAVILPGTERDGAIALGEAICAAVGALSIPHEASSLGHVSISLGIAAARPDESGDVQQLLRAADALLYAAKAAGRNRLAAEEYRSASPSVEPRQETARGAVHNLPSQLSSFVGREEELQS